MIDDDKAGSKEETGGETSRTGCSRSSGTEALLDHAFVHVAFVLGPLSFLFFLFWQRGGLCLLFPAKEHPD